MKYRGILGWCSLVLILSACATTAPQQSESALLALAAPELAQAVHNNPQDQDAWFRLGNGFAENDQLIEAEVAYRQTLLLGAHAKAQHNLGLVHIRLGMEALQAASEQLPADHPSRLETRKFLELMTRAGY